MDSSNTLEEMMAQGRLLRDQTDILNKQLDEIKVEKDALDELMVEKMQSQGITRTGNDIANISLSENETATVADWDALYTFIRENNAFHLLQRRITSKAACEYKEAGEELPGVGYFTKTSLNFRRNN